MNSRGSEVQGRRVRGFAVIVVVAFGCLTLNVTAAFAGPPTVPLTAVTHVTTTSATLEADINTGEKATSYHFEYGLADCAFNPCTSIPSPEEGELAAGKVPVRVTAPIEDLSLATTYHFRVIAKNKEGEVKSPDRIFATHLLPPVFEPCPNDNMRGGPSAKGSSLRLPDCRAYERASPLAKNGTNPLGKVMAMKASPTGDAISFESSSGIPGGEGAQNFPYYLSRRGPEDWSTQGLFPHAKAGEAAQVTGWTLDFSYAFAEVRRSAKEEAYFARSSKDGSLTPIVDYTPGTLNTALAGSSPDGSIVLFESSAQLAPKAAPGETNLYVWDRVSKKVRLAGALPDGTAPESGSHAGPYDWVNGTTPTTLATGGATRNYYTQDDNAISDDASRAYFSAGDTGQLYLRENPASDGAFTKHVSISQKKNGKGPGGTDAAGTRPAAFQTASADGSVAFFTSSEKLTDDATTGSEPDTFPAIGRADITTKPPTDVNLGFLPATAFGVAIDGKYIYWTDPSKGTVGRAKLVDGKEVDPNFIEGLDSPQYLAVDEGYIYWTSPGPLSESGKPQEDQGTIGRADIEGTPPSINQKFIEKASNPQGIAVNATHVFWANSFFFKTSDQNTNNRGTIGRAKLGSTKAEEVDQEFIVMPLAPMVPEGVTLNDTHIYWTLSFGSGSDPNGFVSNRTIDGNPKSEFFIFIAEKTPMTGIALTPTHVYWSSLGSQDAIGRAKLDLTEVEKEFIKPADLPLGLAATATHTYWVANQVTQSNPGNDLYRYDAMSGDLTDLVVDEASPNGAEVRGVLGASEDGSRLYFAANSDLDGAGPATPGNCKGDVITGSGECNLYLWREGGAPEGTIELVTRLETGAGERTDAANWAPTPFGVDPSFTSIFQRASRVSPDGETLLFTSRAQQTAYDSEGTPQFYRYEAGDGSILCVSCSPSGEAPGAPTLGSTFSFLVGVEIPPAALLTRNLSAEGTRVFFETTNALVAEDTNGLEGCPIAGSPGQSFPACRDPYMWEANGTGSCESEAQNGGCLYLLSTGKSPEPSFFADASASGNDAFIITTSQLLPADRDLLYDYYDARVLGGLKSQNQPPPSFCESIDSCRKEQEPSRASESPTSDGPQAAGDPQPERNRSCPKGKRKVRVKGKVRCVSKRHKRQRAANSKRRVSR